MKKLVSTLHLDHKEWLKYRKRGIGGSDAGAVCGLNPYRTAMQVYYDKISDDIEENDNEAMRQGRELEEYVAKRFSEATGKKVKTASPYMEEKWRDGKIPLSYQIQCYHYMSVCNAQAWYIAVLIYGKDFIFRRIDRDEQVIADLIRIEKEFWQEHVMKKVLPDPDGSRTADAVIAERFREAQGAVIPLAGFDDRLRRRQEILELMDRMETEKRKIDQELKLYLGEAETAENENFRVSWKNVSRSSLDEKRLKEEHPEIYAAYRRETSSRRFTVRAA